MNINFENINKVLDAIFPLPPEFGVESSSNDVSEEPALAEIEHRIFKVDPRAFIRHGISKLVLISPNFGNVVIKIPFKGTRCEEYFISDSEDEESEYEYYTEFTEFSGASDRDSSDYCLLEYEIYNTLKHYSFSCFAVKTIFYKIIEGTRIFLQEMACPEEECDESFDISEKSEKTAIRWRHEHRYSTSMDTNWVAACIDKYGERKTKKFFEFADENNLLYDMHNGNYGYRKGGYPVLIDFSDFNG